MEPNLAAMYINRPPHHLLIFVWFRYSTWLQGQLPVCYVIEWNVKNLLCKKGYVCKWTHGFFHLCALTQINVKQQCFHCCSTFHSRVYNNELNSYQKKKKVKWPLACSWVVFFFFLSINYIWASLSFWHNLMYRILFLRYGGY